MSVTKVTGMMQTSTKGGDIPSASPTVIDTDGDYFDVTGTTNFAAFTVVAGRRFTVQFDGALTMTHHATTLDLPGGANITTAAGDVAEFFATGTNTVQCVNYTKADGTAVVLADNSITLAKMAGGTDGNIISFDTSGNPVAVATGTDGQVLTSSGADTVCAFEDPAAGGYTAATPFTSTSGTSHDFTGIPAGVKHIMILFRSTSLSGTESFDINLGDSGGIETGTDHTSSGHVIHGTTLTTLSSGDALQVLIANAAHAADVVCHLVNIEDTNWVFAYSGHTWYTGSALGGGAKNLSGTLTQIRVSSSSSDTFDYGFVNIVYL